MRLPWTREKRTITRESTFGDEGESPSGIARPARTIDTYWRLYRDNPIVHAAIVEVVHALLSIPLVAEVYDSDRRAWFPLRADHKLSQLMRRPSRTISAAQFFGGYYTSLAVTGNAFAWIRETNGGGILEFQNVPTKHILPKPDDTEALGGYLFDPKQPIGDRAPGTIPDPSTIRTYPVDQIVHTALDVDPSYPLLGLSPLAAILDDIALDEAISDFTAAIMGRQSVVDHAFITRRHVEDREARRIERRWLKRRSGPKSAGGLTVIDGTEGDLKKIGMSIGARDMGLVDLRKTIEARILMALDVPPIIVGSVIGLENATYSNYMQARLGFHEENTDPNLWRISSAFEQRLDGRYGDLAGKLMRIRPDLSRVMALLDWEDKRRRLALAEFAGGATSRDEARGAVDRPPAETPDFSVVPLNVQRIDSDGNDIVTPEPAAADATPPDVSRSRMLRLRRAVSKGEPQVVTSELGSYARSLGADARAAEEAIAFIFGGGDPEFDNYSATKKAYALLDATRRYALRQIAEESE